VKCIANLLETLHAYFAHSAKKHVKFTKIVDIMETKGNKILHNVKTQWISMLNPAKIMMAEYRTLLVKMAMDYNTNKLTRLNYEHLCNLQILLRLA